jgi:outer membrane protein OmpA-like peptidoglycan-associated protein
MPRWLQIGLIAALVVVGLTLAKPLGTGTVRPDNQTYSESRLDALIDSMHDAHVERSASRIHLRGVASSGDEWTRLLAQFRASIAEGVELSVDVFVVDTELSLDEMCEQIFMLVTKERVSFRQSGTALRTSSAPVLDRLADFARDCSQLTIAITGHSDASGNETNNKALSQARAQVVADYLVAHGVAADALSVAGAGSDFPIADNATPQGREQNRRIEFELLLPQ